MLMSAVSIMEVVTMVVLTLLVLITAPAEQDIIYNLISIVVKVITNCFDESYQ